MAERIKDAEDRLLESMFESEPLADNGFSEKLVRRVSRRLWIRRITLPAAAIIGAAISFKPMTDLVATLKRVANLLPQDVLSSAVVAFPQFQTIVFGAMLFVVCLLGVRVLSD